MSETLARFQWESGDERPLPANIVKLDALARDFRRTEGVLRADFAGYPSYLAAVQDAYQGPELKRAKAVEAKAAQAEAEILRHLASIAAQLRILRDLSRGVQVTVDESNARLKAAASKAGVKF